jgi:hypothetical protein
VQGHHRSCADRACVRAEGGAALLVSLMLLLLLAALGLSLALTCMAETRISGSYATGAEALYAAEAAAERVIADLLALPDWDRVLDGTVAAVDRDGPAGPRDLPDGSRLDLAHATSTVRCGRPAGCSDADMAAVTSDRPWGANNPRWQLYASAPLRSMLRTGTVSSMAYVLVWAGDDSGESDGNPLADTNGTILLLAHAYAPGGVRRAIEVAIARALAPASHGGGQVGIRVLSWREVP